MVSPSYLVLLLPALLFSLGRAGTPQQEEVGHVFSSTNTLMKLMNVERSSIKTMRDYLTQRKENVKQMKFLRKRLEETRAFTGRYEGVDHALNAVRIVNRFVAIWKRLYGTAFNATSRAMVHQHVYGGLGELMPRPADYHGTYKCLLRLQVTYKLAAEDMAAGEVRGKRASPMDRMDCLNMALTAIQAEYTQEALAWTRLAGERSVSYMDKWEINRDVDDFQQRMTHTDKSKMQEIVLDYLLELVGYSDEADEFYDDDEEEDDSEHEEPSRVEENHQAPSSEVAELDDEGEDEVGSSDFIPGALHVAQFENEVELEHEVFDFVNRMQDQHAKQQQKLKKQQESVESVTEDDDDSTTIETEPPVVEQPAPQHGQCGGSGETQVVEERTVSFGKLGGLGGANLKIKYQGREISVEEMDEIQKMAEDSLGHEYQYNNDQETNYKYYALCRGEEVTRRYRSTLHCRYRSTALPYNRWREEIVNKDPLISVIYNVITDSEIAHVKELSSRQLIRAMAGDKAIDERVQSSSWHEDATSTVVAALSRKAGVISGLDCLRSAEPWQIGQYGIGGFYAVHYDYDPERFKHMGLGDRIGTFMLYLNEVEEGGYTVFPNLGLHIKPVKGSAVMWHNLLRNGTPDPRTLHAACPVLIGHKWVANKWIHEFGNEFNRPCGKGMASMD